MSRARRGIVRYSVLVSALAFFLVGTSSGSASGPRSVANGKIAFSSDRRIQAGEASSRDGFPPPPPPPPRQWDVHTVDDDGTGFARLTTRNQPFALAPTWSPDGSRIAFHGVVGPTFDLFVMDADGTNQTNVTNSSDSNEFDPAWSPDGSRIAFESTLYGDGEIFMMNADGSDATRLTTNSALDGEPSWSPDGRSIAFSSDRAGGGPEGYRLGLTSLERRPL